MQDGLCPICHLKEEDATHCITKCPQATPTRFNSKLQWYPNEGCDFKQWLRDILNFQPNTAINLTRTYPICCNHFWGVWKTRNEHLFEGMPLDSKRTISKIVEMHDSFWKANPRNLASHTIQQNTNGPNTHKWNPPREGKFKCNIDASFLKRIKICTTGTIIRGYHRQMITSTRSILPAGSPLFAEALALRETITLVNNLKIRPHVLSLTAKI